jgi:hypothetical protein
LPVASGQLPAKASNSVGNIQLLAGNHQPRKTDD